MLVKPGLETRLYTKQNLSEPSNLPPYAVSFVRLKGRTILLIYCIADFAQGNRLSLDSAAEVEF